MLYAIVPLRLPKNNDLELPDKVKLLQVPTYDKQAPLAYFVSYKGTTTELYEALGYKDGEEKKIGAVIVIPLTNYVGYGPKNLWEWLEIHDGD